MSSVANGSAAAELQSVSGRTHTAKAVLQKVSGASTALISVALSRANLSQKEAALTMGVSESLLTRQLKGDCKPGDEHLSWQRLFLLPDKFFLELLIVIAETRGIASVRTQIEFERRVG
jgi:hypothetical protein